MLPEYGVQFSVSSINASISITSVAVPAFWLFPEGNDSWGGFYFNMGDAADLPYSQKCILVVAKADQTELQIYDNNAEASLCGMQILVFSLIAEDLFAVNGQHRTHVCAVDIVQAELDTVGLAAFKRELADLHDERVGAVIDLKLCLICFGDNKNALLAVKRVSAFRKGTLRRCCGSERHGRNAGQCGHEAHD